MTGIPKSTTPKKKIAFIRKGPIPLASDSIVEELRKNFPNFEVETIDILQMITKRKDIILINIFFIIKEYGPDILHGKIRLKDVFNKRRINEKFFKTSYIFRKIKALVSKHLAKQPYEFSFQMQSLYDVSKDGLPHFVYTDHTNLANLSYPIPDINRLGSKPWRELERTIYHNATLVFTWSNNIKQSLVEQYGCNPDKVIPVYVGSNIRINHVALDNGMYANKNILFVGVEWERKGGPELAEAFKLVSQVHPDAQLTIVGCSPHLDIPNCRVIGRIPLEEVGEYYKKASVFCLPTKVEPFGVVFIEASYYKLPIVGTNVGAVPDLVLSGENGYLVSPGDVQALAQALIDLLGNPQKCQTFGERGYYLALERYTWEKVGAKIRENILSIYPKSN